MGIEKKIKRKQAHAYHAPIFNICLSIQLSPSLKTLLWIQFRQGYDFHLVWWPYYDSTSAKDTTQTKLFRKPAIDMNICTQWQEQLCHETITYGKHAQPSDAQNSSIQPSKSEKLSEMDSSN